MGKKFNVLNHEIVPLHIKLSKEEARKILGELGLRPSDLPWILASDPAVKAIGAKPGDIVHSTGEILGHHRGVAFYTIGQRHGLGTAWGKPLYVIRIETSDNRVVLGTEEELYSQQAIVKEVNWITNAPPAESANITAKIRYRSLETPVTLSPKGENINVWFPQPQRAVTPGQAIVFYDGDEVLGGGIIENFFPMSSTRKRENHVLANQAN